MNIFKSIFIAIFFVFVVSCNTPTEQTEMLDSDLFELVNDTLIKLRELQPCDILVKPNLNWVPGTSMVEGGRGFGHAVIVVEGATGNSAMEVLQKAKIFESHSRNVPEEYQLRCTNGYKNVGDLRFDNNSFDEKYKGYRYRLRYPLNNNQKKAILQFVLKQDPDISNWRSMKMISSEGDKSTWYCSLLIWQAYYSVLGIDLDENGGRMVFPNDLISSPYFDNDEKNKEKRVRF